MPEYCQNKSKPKWCCNKPPKNKTQIDLKHGQFEWSTNPSNQPKSFVKKLHHQTFMYMYIPSIVTAASYKCGQKNFENDTWLKAKLKEHSLQSNWLTNGIPWTNWYENCRLSECLSQITTDSIACYSFSNTPCFSRVNKWVFVFPNLSTQQNKLKMGTYKRYDNSFSTTKVKIIHLPDKVLVDEQLLLTLTIVLSLHMSTLEPWHDPAFVDANPDDDRRVRLSNLANNSIGQE